MKMQNTDKRHLLELNTVKFLLGVRPNNSDSKINKQNKGNETLKQNKRNDLLDLHICTYIIIN